MPRRAIPAPAPARGRRLQGRIDYLDRDGCLTGEEDFELLMQGAGGTLRARCELHDAGVLRDVSMAFDERFRPLDGFCRVTRHGSIAGATWFAFAQQRVDVESRLHDRGRLTQCFDNDPPFVYLGLHPLQGDALVATQADHARPGEFVVVRGLTNSVSENGDRDLYARAVDIEVAYLGDEEIAVRAGRFAARHYQLRWHPDWPPAALWVRAPDFVFLKLTWAQVGASYELSALEEHDAPA